MKTDGFPLDNPIAHEAWQKDEEVRQIGAQFNARGVRLQFKEGGRVIVKGPRMYLTSDLLDYLSKNRDLLREYFIEEERELY